MDSAGKSNVVDGAAKSNIVEGAGKSNIVDVFNREGGKAELKKETRAAYQEAFHCFDWNRNGKISHGSLQNAMRRAGINPTDVEVHDMINKIDDGTGVLTFEMFCTVMLEKVEENDPETNYKESFRVFGKDEEGCIPAEELQFVLKNLPGNVRLLAMCQLAVLVILF